MNILQSFAIAISMYSKIPMPDVEWKKENMRYAMCFFPFVGVVIGAVTYLIGRILFQLSVGPVFRGVVFTLIPLFVSGGIHMDGFMDTMDALASYGDQEKKLEILKDSHAGAFAILGLGCYLIWNVAVWSELGPELLGISCLIYTVSRALSGLSVVTFQAARNSGLLRTFQDGAQKRTVGITMTGYLVLSLCAAFVADWRAAAGMILAAGLTFYYSKHICKKQFGGVTGDLAGYFLELSELLMLTGILICGGGLWS